MAADPPASVTWPSLADEHAPDAAAMLQRYLRLRDQLPRLEGRALTDQFAGSDSTLARGCLFVGAAATREVVAACHPSVARVLGVLDDMKRKDTAIVHHVVNFALIAECIGTPRPAGVDADRMKPLVAKRAEHFDAARRSMAFTSLALGDAPTALAFLDAKPASYEQPRLSFEFNLYELIRYLAAALDRRWPADWIEPAWLEYLEGFPLHLAADAAEWPDLFMFARVLAALRGDKVADIADDLHARVQRLAQETE
jgi:hypothetical protein